MALRRKARWKKRLGTALLLLLLLPLLLPWLLEPALRLGVGVAGYGQLEVENIDIDPFVGQLRIEGLTLHRFAARPLALNRLELDISPQALLEHHLEIRRLAIDGLDLLLQRDRAGRLLVAATALTAPGGGESAGEGASPPWQLTLDQLSLRDVTLHLTRLPPAREVAIDTLKLSNLSTRGGGKEASLSARLRVDRATLQLDAQGTPFAAAPRSTIALELNGFPLARLNPLLPKATRLAGRLDTALTIELKQHSGTTLTVTPKGTISLGKLMLSQGQTALQAEKLSWQGELPLAFAPHFTTITAPATELTASGLTLNQTALQLSAGEIQWQGQLAATLRPNAPAELSAGGNLDLNDLTLGAPTAAPLTVAAAEVDAFAILLPNRLEAERIALHTLQLAVARDRSGTLRHPLTPAATPAEAAGEGSEGTEPAPPLQLHLGALRIDRQSRIRFRDEAVRPKVVQQLNIQRLDLKPLDLTGDRLNTALTLKGRLGDYAPLRLDASVARSRGTTTLELNGELNDFDLSTISPYLVDALGYEMRSGQLDTTLTLALEGSQVEGEAKLHLSKPEVKAVNRQGSEELEQQNTLPLGMALAMLRDSEENVELTVPFSGDTSQPDFRVTDVVNTALGKAMRFGAFTYLKMTLQPYSSVISVIQLAGGALTAIRLEPIPFAAGEAELSAEAVDYLERLTTLFQERPDLQVRVCGQAVAADMEALQIKEVEGPRLLELARSRAEAIKQQLVEEGIAAKAIFLCAPEWRGGEGEPPQAELLVL